MDDENNYQSMTEPNFNDMKHEENEDLERHSDNEEISAEIEELQRAIDDDTFGIEQAEKRIKANKEKIVKLDLLLDDTEF